MSEADKIIKNLKNSGKKVEEFYVSNKTSDKNVGSIEKDIRNIKQYINLVLDKGYCDCNELNVISTGKYCDGSKNVAYSMQNILAEREQMLKTINTVEKEKGEWIKAYQEEKDKQFNILINSIPKQKIKDLLTEIQEEYNKLDKEIDKQIKDKNKDYYKCKENIAIMQTLAYCRDKFEGLLEEK